MPIPIVVLVVAFISCCSLNSGRPIRQDAVCSNDCIAQNPSSPAQKSREAPTRDAYLRLYCSEFVSGVNKNESNQLRYLKSEIGHYRTRRNRGDSACTGGLGRGRLRLALQRHLDRFPFAQFFHAAFPVGTVGLVIAPRMVFHQNQHVTRFPFEVRKGALNQQARLRQGQGRCFF